MNIKNYFFSVILFSVLIYSNSNFAQTSIDTLKVKDTSGNTIYNFIDEGTFGSIYIKSGVPSNTTYKLYNNNGVLFFNGNPLESNNIQELNDLNDAKTGLTNVFLGELAGNNAIDGSGDFNVGVGNYSLSNISTADSNTAAGYKSLFHFITSSRNTAIGASALEGNYVIDNTALGSDALKNNFAGAYNTAIGYNALFSNSGGFVNNAYNNIGLGVQSLLDNTDGKSNLAIGTETLKHNTLGNYNVGIGYGANYWNQEGNNNTIIGYLAANGSGANNNFGCVFVGFQAGKFENNSYFKLFIENSSSSSPLIWGDFANDIIKINGEFVVKGRASLGATATVTGSNSFAIGSKVSVGGSGSIYLCDDSPTIANILPATNNRFISRFANGYRLWTDSGLNFGAELAANATAWSVMSDSTKKENFKYVNGIEVLDKISKLKLTSCNYKGQDSKLYRHYGTMAQEFFSAFGNDGIGIVGTDTSITTSDIDGINLIAIQALEKEAREQENRIQELQKFNENLISVNKEYQKWNDVLFSEIIQIKSAVNQIVDAKNQQKFTSNN